MNAKKAVPGWVIILLTVIVAIAYMLFSHKAHYEVLFPILFIGGIASGLAQKEYKKSQQQNPEMYPAELKPKSTLKKVLLWIGGTIVSLIVVVIMLGIAVQMTQDEHPDASATSSSVKLPEFQDPQANQIFKALIAVNNNVKEDPVITEDQQNKYFIQKCNALGTMVQELNEAANKGMISATNQNIDFVANLMKENNLNTVSDYIVAVAIVNNEAFILLSQNSSEDLNASFTEVCESENLYKQAYQWSLEHQAQ